MTKKNTLTVRTILYTISKVLSRGINALTAVVFVRLLTTEEYGYVSVYTAWVSLVSVFISLRTDGTIQMARTKYGEEKIDEYSSSALTISMIVFGLVVVGTTLFMLTGQRIITRPFWYVFLVLIHSFGSACLQFRAAYYAITKEAFKDLLVSVAVSVLSFGAALFLVLIMPVNKYIGRMVGFAFANVLLGVFFAITMLRKGRCYYKREYYSYCIKLSIPLIFSGLSSVLMSQMDRLMLESMVNAEATAIYSFAYNVVLPISIIWYSLNHAWVPEYHEIMKQQNMEKIQKHSRNYMFVFTGISCGYVLIANEVLMIMGTQDYYVAKTILPLMTLYYYMQFLYTFPINYEFFKSNTKLLGLAMSCAAVMNLVLNYCLIPKFGMLGALVASIASSFFMLVFHDINARYILKNYHYTWRFYLSGLVPFIFAIITSYVFMDAVVVRWIVAMLIGVCLLHHVYKEKAII